MAHEPNDIRNVVLLGHGGSGKTALVDALAFATKLSPRHGDSADGTSISNTEPEEKERKQTLTSHPFSFPLEGGKTLNVVDTPGHADFVAEAIAPIWVVETALVCVSAAAGLTFHTRQLWAEAGKASLARAIVLTHPDGENAKFDEVLAELVEVFGDRVVPITYPDATGAAFGAVHDVLAGEGPMAEKYRETLDERVAEADDELLETYLEEGSLSDEVVARHFAAAVIKGKLVPLFTVCPPKMAGVEQLMRAAAKLLPSPVDYGPRPAGKPGSDTYDQLVEPDPSQPFAARVFKVVVDPYVGLLSYLRCFRGRIGAEDGFYNVRTRKHEKLGGLLGLEAKQTQSIDRVVAGDLFAVGKVEDLALGDTVTADGAELEFPRIEYPEPTYSLAVTPKSRGDEQKINQGLEKLAAEDPTFKVQRDPATGELVISGMSPLHLEVQLARLQRRYGVQTEQHAPRIPYRETITTKADGHHRHKKQTGGRGQFAEVFLRVAPRERGSGFEFIDSIVGGAIPRQFIPEVEKGIRKFLEKGGLAGCPVVDVSAEVYDGKFHDVDSDQLSFQLAGERAFADGFAKAKPILLEPIMEVEIRVPERFTGDVAGNLSTHRGRMQGMEVQEGIQVIKAQVPLKEMQEYSTQLRSITAGEGTFTMRFSHYEQVPGNLQAEIVAEYRKAQEEGR